MTTGDAFRKIMEYQNYLKRISDVALDISNYVDDHDIMMRFIDEDKLDKIPDEYIKYFDTSFNQCEKALLAVSRLMGDTFKALIPYIDYKTYFDTIGKD